MTARIAVDCRMVQFSGIGTYVRGLLGGMTNLELPADYSLTLMGIHGKSKGVPENWKRGPFNSSIYSVTEQLEYPFRLAGFDLWHSPHYNVPVFPRKAKLVTTIHDLIHWIFRKDFFTPLQALYAGRMLKAAVEKSDHIITVSQKTADDLMEHFQAKPEKISVIYEGVSPRFRENWEPERQEALRQKYHLSEQFFLYVGLIKPHKNVLSLIRLFRELKKEGKIDASLVLVGKKDRRYPKNQAELASLTSDADVIHIPYVESHELPLFYAQALALVHPSLYEGFGLTLLEAMACGTPVVACRAASIPEVVGDAGWLVEPHATGEMKEALMQIEKSPELRKDFRWKGLEQVKKFSWTETARQTLQVYEKVLHG